MQSLDAEIQQIVRQSTRRPPAPLRRSFPTRDEQLRMEFALSVVEFLPSRINLLTYDLSSNPHLPYVLSEDEPWKSALVTEPQQDILKRRLPQLRLNLHLDLAPLVPQWAAV